jgi:hypothetical protein
LRRWNRHGFQRGVVRCWHIDALKMINFNG